MRFSTAESTVFTRPETQWAKIPPITSTIRSGERPMSVRNQPTTAAVPRAPSTIAMTGMPGPGNARFGGSPICERFRGRSPRESQPPAARGLRADRAEGAARELHPGGRKLFPGWPVPAASRRGGLRRAQHQGGADPFKQRATAEDVEIGGVGMVVVEIRQALRSQPLPPAFEPAQAV